MGSEWEDEEGGGQNITPHISFFGVCWVSVVLQKERDDLKEQLGMRSPVLGQGWEQGCVGPSRVEQRQT